MDHNSLQMLWSLSATAKKKWVPGIIMTLANFCMLIMKYLYSWLIMAACMRNIFRPFYCIFHVSMLCSAGYYCSSVVVIIPRRICGRNHTTIHFWFLYIRLLIAVIIDRWFLASCQEPWSRRCTCTSKWPRKKWIFPFSGLSSNQVNQVHGMYTFAQLYVRMMFRYKCRVKTSRQHQFSTSCERLRF